MSVQEELLLDTFLIDGTSYWLGLTDLAQEGGNRKNMNFFILIRQPYINIISFLQELTDGRKVTRKQTMLTGPLVNQVGLLQRTVF